MFNQLADRFDTIFRNLRGLGKITDANIQQTSREIRRVLFGSGCEFQSGQSVCEPCERSCRRDKSSQIGQTGRTIHQDYSR